MTEIRDERLQLRVTPAAKRRLKAAADVAHLDLTAFVLQSAQQRADEVLANRSLIALSPDAAEQFLSALEAPARVNERLLGALQRPAKVDWLD
jgi:uncharacterized protein (DUF1778 family)